MNRWKFQLQAQPIAIKKAVAGLEKKRRDWKEGPLSFEGFITELPKIPRKTLLKMKLRKSAQELLPYILVDSKLDPSIQKPLFILIESKISQMSESTRNRVFCFGLLYPQIRKIGYQYFQRNAPASTSPKWILEYWRQIFRPENPIAMMSSILCDHHVPITDSAVWLGLNPYAPFMDTLYETYHELHDCEWLRSCPYWDVVSFARSAAPKAIRSSILVWVLNSYVQDWAEWSDVPEPYQILIEMAWELWGEPHRAYWAHCSHAVSTVGEWAYLSKMSTEMNI